MEELIPTAAQYGFPSLIAVALLVFLWKLVMLLLEVVQSNTSAMVGVKSAIEQVGKAVEEVSKAVTEVREAVIEMRRAIESLGSRLDILERGGRDGPSGGAKR